MVRLELLTTIAAPIERVLDLSRSIDLHMASTDWTGERAIAGATSGLIGPDQEVTWQGRHFGISITHTSRITKYEFPNYFQDCVVHGSFRRFCHDHYFEGYGVSTRMKDVMEFEAPCDHWEFLSNAWRSNATGKISCRDATIWIRKTAESEDWRKFVL